MQKPSIDESKLHKVMEIIDKAACLMEEKDCINDAEAMQELSGLQKQLEEITGNNSINVKDSYRYWSYTSLEETAKKFLMLPPAKENLSDYIFYPDMKGLNGDATLSEIADKIISDMKHLV